MTTYRDFVTAFQRLNIHRSRPVIVHASLSTFGDVNGGASTVVGALLAAFDTIIMPTFTYQTMLIPEAGPPNNGLEYGTGSKRNQKAEFFRPGTPADRSMGVVPETFRRLPDARRTLHPILSFAGTGAANALDSQTLAEPLMPILRLMESDGWVLLLGVGHTSNTSIHFAERLAGRKQFIRWALTPTGVIKCPRFPGCSDAFNEVGARLRTFTRRIKLGNAWVQAIRLAPLVEVVNDWIAAHPTALLCDRIDCQRCQTVRSFTVPV